MKKISLIFILITVMLAALILAACNSNNPATSTASTTDASATTTTAPATTTTAPVNTTAPVTTTESPDATITFPNLYYNGELQLNVPIFEAWGLFTYNDNGDVVADFSPSIGELVGIEFTKGTIEVDMIMSESAGEHPLLDSGICFAVSDPFNPTVPYYWETQASYYFALIHDYRGFGISRVGFDHGNGPIAWDWMPNSEGQIMTAGPFWTTDGGEKVTVKIETDGETYIKGFVNGDYVAYFSIPEGGNLFTSGGTINKKVAIRAEGRGQVFTKIEIFQED